MNRIHLSAALLVGLGSLSTASAALVTNGNFASPAQSAGGFTNFSPGSTGITNFTATGGTSGGAQLLGTTYGATAGGGGQNFPIVPTAGEQTLQLFVNAPGGRVDTDHHSVRRDRHH